MTVASVMPAMMSISVILADWAFDVLVLGMLGIFVVVVGCAPAAEVEEGKLLENDVATIVEGLNSASKAAKAEKAGGVVMTGAETAVTVRLCVASTCRYDNAASSHA